MIYNHNILLILDVIDMYKSDVNFHLGIVCLPWCVTKPLCPSPLHCPELMTRTYVSSACHLHVSNKAHRQLVNNHGSYLSCRLGSRYQHVLSMSTGGSLCLLPFGCSVCVSRGCSCSCPVALDCLELLCSDYAFEDSPWICVLEL